MAFTNKMKEAETIRELKLYDLRESRDDFEKVFKTLRFLAIEYPETNFNAALAAIGEADSFVAGKIEELRK